MFSTPCKGLMCGNTAHLTPCKGLMCGNTAHVEYINFFNKNGQNEPLKFDKIELVFNTSTFDSLTNHFSVSQKNSLYRFYRIKKKSNRKFEVMIDDQVFSIEREKCLGSLDETNSPNCLSRKFDGKIFNGPNIENILMVEIKILMAPLIDLKKCQDLNEALMNWSLNNLFLPNQVYVDCGQIQGTDVKILNQTIEMFLSLASVKSFVPHVFLKKITNSRTTEDFLKTIIDLNKYFVQLVKRYRVSEKIHLITSYDICFSIDLFGSSLTQTGALNDKRKSLFLRPRAIGDIKFKAFAVLFNLRWFFNTVYNGGKSIGIDGEYGNLSTKINEYGQTFHKYDDVLLWLVTHPNNVLNSEFVILDPIPTEWIF